MFELKNKKLEIIEETQESIIEYLEQNKHITPEIKTLIITNTEFEDVDILTPYFNNLEKITITTNPILKHTNRLYLLPKLKEINIDGKIKKLPKKETLRMCEFLDSFVIPQKEGDYCCTFNHTGFLKMFQNKDDLKNFLTPIFENNPKKQTNIINDYLHCIDDCFSTDFYVNVLEDLEYEEDLQIHEDLKKEVENLDKCSEIISHSKEYFEDN